MKWRLFGLVAGFLAAICVFAPRSPQVEAAGDAYPRASAAMNAVLTETHKTWRKDAVVFQAEVQGIPGFYWVQLALYSPSNGAILNVTAGGPRNGQFSFGFSKPQDSSKTALPPDFKVDLPDAMANLARVGLKGPLGVTRLQWPGAQGTPPLLAWSIRVAGGPVMFPLFVDAQDGRAVQWQRAMDPPNGSDAQLKAAWDRLLNRNQPKAADARRAWEEWSALQWCIAPLPGMAAC